ncbi:hypothetical protein RND71_015936 [Anisodus tanguticus]|uniref:Uncharacterized protein n=1 Tax=Anisodus tanguticus TaxID=243964 RepID=A0AAE1S8E4_9SOLA|nr:hypothetical protein RND71_015936 [Anisodus tanguticus]
MDETGVHSRLNVKKPIVSGIGTTSPVQTVAGKDKSNPLKVVTLPKSESEEEISLKTRQDIDHVSETSSENELIQYAQDPNENDDSGMSFDSIAEHNLNT